MLKNTITQKILFFIFITLTVLAGCNKKIFESIPPQERKGVDSYSILAKKYLNGDKNLQELIINEASGLEINWDGLRLFEDSEGQLFIYLDFKNPLEKKERYAVSFLFDRDYNEIINSQFLKYEPDDDYFGRNRGSHSYGKFTGRILYFSNNKQVSRVDSLLDGINFKSYIVQKKSKVSPFEKRASSIPDIGSHEFITARTNGYTVLICPVCTTHYSEFNEMMSLIQDEACTVCGNCFQNCGGEWGGTNPPVEGGGGSGTPGSSTSPDDKILEFDLAIEDGDLDACLRTVVLGLRNSEKSSIGMILQKFAGNVPGYNWEIKYSPLSMENDQYARTNLIYYQDSKKVITELNPDRVHYKYASELSMAATLMHESVHAYLTTLYYTDKQVILENYPQLLSKFLKRHKSPANEVQHDLFVTQFKNDIAISLKDYGEQRAHQLSDQFYNDLAWTGLTNTNAFLNLPEAEQKRILGTILAERYDNKVETNGQIQKGKKLGCN